MIHLEKRHFNLNRILLLAIGLWPYRRSKFVRFQLILLFGILTTFIIFQFTTLLISKFTTDFIIQVLSSTFFNICLAIKYNSFWINADIVRRSLEQLQHICNELNDENEIAIIKKYGNTAKRYTAVLTIFSMCYISIIIILPIWPCILDVLLPINESRPSSSLHIMTEYFINQQRYFYLIILYRNAAFCIGEIAMLATGTTFLTYFQHICGMLSIASSNNLERLYNYSKRITYSFRIEQAMKTNMLQDVRQENQILIYKRIIYAIDIHRKSTESSKCLISNFEGSFFFLIASGIVCLSSSLVQIASSHDDTAELILPFTSISVLYVYLFLSNYTAQEVTDHNNHVFATVYNVQWYAAPLRIQKTILFMLQRGTKAFNLNLGGLFVGSLESAAMLTSTSISYFTVLYSMRQN